MESARAMLETLRRSGYPMERIRLVVNRCDARPRRDLGEVERAVDRDVFAAIPFDPAVARAAVAGVPLVERSRRSKAARALAALADRLHRDLGSR
jgi:Flp pilus assembly CpaE family ATPase